MTDAKHFCWQSEALHHILKVVPVCVGDEDLSEFIGADNLKYHFGSLAVKFVEHVVKQQQRVLSDSLEQQFVLCEFEGSEVCLVLSFRSGSFDGISAERHVQFVFVYSVSGKSDKKVSLSCASQHVI